MRYARIVVKRVLTIIDASVTDHAQSYTHPHSSEQCHQSHEGDIEAYDSTRKRAGVV